MKLTKLPHAGVIVVAGKSKIICDPLFPGGRIESIFRLPADYSIDKIELKKTKFDAILISHDHGDHFDLPSLRCLNRESPVYYPAQLEHIRSKLMFAGFKHFIPIKPGRTYAINDVELIPTLSRAPNVEVGFILRWKGLSFWNLVDSQLRQSDLKSYRKKFGRPNLLFAFYQILNEHATSTGTSTEFPFRRYQPLLDTVRAAYPRVVVPSSADLVYADDPDIHQFLHPISRENFIADIERSEPSIKGALFLAGEHRQLTGQKLTKISAPLPKLKITKSVLPRHTWQPDRLLLPIPQLKIAKKALAELKVLTNREVDGRLQSLLKSKMNDSMFRELQSEELSWKLRLVFPDGSELVRLLHFSKFPIKWMDISKTTAEFEAGVETILSAQTLLAFVSGKICLFGLVCGLHRRVVSRHYSVKGWKVKGLKLPPTAPLEQLFWGELAETNRLSHLFKDPRP